MLLNLNAVMSIIANVPADIASTVSSGNEIGRNFVKSYLRLSPVELFED